MLLPPACLPACLSVCVQPLINFEILLLVNSVYRNMPPPKGNIKVAKSQKFCLHNNLTLIHGQTEETHQFFIEEHMANKTEYPRHMALETLEATFDSPAKKFLPKVKSHFLT